MVRLYVLLAVDLEWVSSTPFFFICEGHPRERDGQRTGPAPGKRLFQFQHSEFERDGAA
jgi:hypothetical protein